MKKLWLRATPFNDDLVRFILIHCVSKVEELVLDCRNFTNQALDNILERLRLARTKEPVKLYCITQSFKFILFLNK